MGIFKNIGADPLYGSMRQDMWRDTLRDSIAVFSPLFKIYTCAFFGEGKELRTRRLCGLSYALYNIAYCAKEADSILIEFFVLVIRKHMSSDGEFNIWLPEEDCLKYLDSIMNNPEIMRGFQELSSKNVSREYKECPIEQLQQYSFLDFIAHCIGNAPWPDYDNAAR